MTGTPAWADGHCQYPLRQFRYLFERVERPVPPNAEVVTAYTDGVVTFRRNRRIDGYHEAATLDGFKGVVAGDFVVHGLDILRGSVGISDSTGAISAVCITCRPREGAEPQFFAYAIRAQAWTGYTKAFARGVREGGADFRRWATLGDLRLPVPPYPVQRAVVDHLAAETARIDTLIEKKRAMAALFQMRWRSAAASALSRMADQFGSVPLRRTVECLDRRRIPLSAEERAGRSGPFPYYGASAIVDSIDDYLFDEDLVLVGEDGAQLGDPEYPIAQRVSGKIWVNNHAHVLRPTRIDPDLLVLYLNTFDRVPFISGATREKFTQEDLGRIPVPAAPAEVQKRVALELRALRERSDSLTGLIMRQIELLHEHRQALVIAAITGQLASAKTAA